MTLTVPNVRLLLPPKIGTVLLELADCVCGELAANGGGPTCWCGLWPGLEVSWEYCGECGSGACGMGYVRVGEVFPYSTFPVPEFDQRCEKPLAWTIEVGALRCMPQPADGTVASPAELTEVTLKQVADMWALYRAVHCCATTMTAVEQYIPQGPEGGCVGGFWRAFFSVD